MELIDKDAVVAEIENKIKKYTHHGEESDFLQDGNAKYWGGVLSCLNEIHSYLDTLEVKEVDLEKESELIANGIMISVQSNKYGTNIYNTKRNDFNHYHLQMAARKGIEFGIKTQKGE